MLGAKSWEVRRENVREFFRWALLDKGDEAKAGQGKAPVDEQTRSEEEEELSEYVDGVQTLLGRTLEPGRGSAKSLRLTVDKVKMLHRPVVWYLVCLLPPAVGAC